mgnify:CR=1 FL=1
MKLLNIVKKLQSSLFFIGLLIVGLAFTAFTILPWILPDKFSDDSSLPVKLLFLAVGIAAVVFAVIRLHKIFTTSTDEMNYFDKVSIDEASPEMLESIRNSSEPRNDYYFYFCGKLNQSYIMETTERKTVFELNCDHIGVVDPYVYTFKSHITNTEFTSKVSHTVTTSFESAGGFSLVDTSYFKIDGIKCWDYIAQKGYSIEPYLESVAWSFRVKHYGIYVADIVAAGSNILPQYEGKGGFRDIPTNYGLYRISCRESDVDAVALAAFIASRVQIV